MTHQGWQNIRMRFLAYIEKLPGKTDKAFWLLFTPITLLIIVGAWTEGYSRVEAQLTMIRANEKAFVDISGGRLQEALTKPLTHLQSIVKETAVKSVYTGNNVHTEPMQNAFITLLSRNPEYDQVRWIDEKGMERVRVNNSLSGPVVVSSSDLQDKHNRYYFIKAMELHSGEIYISPIDLNIEHGKIEEPYKPMVRIAAHVFDSAGKPHGILIINIAIKSMLKTFVKSAGPVAGRLMLLNQDGYWLRSPDPKQEWGFMFSAHNNNFGEQYPSAWHFISKHKGGQIRLNNGLWTWQTVLPVPSDLMMKDRRELRVVTHIPDKTLATIVHRVEFTNAIGSLLLLLLFGVGLSHLITARESRLSAETEAKIARRDAEAAKSLEAANRRFRLLFEADTNALIVVDSVAKIVMVNPQTERLFGYSSEDLLNQSIEMLVPEGYRKQHVLNREGYIHHPTAREMGKDKMLHARHKDGHVFPIEVGLSPYEDNNQRFVLATVADITERKRVQTELIQLKDYLEQRVIQRTAELEAANQELDSFAYAVAHDLRTPLRAMTGFSQALIEDFGNSLETEARMYLDHIIAGSDRMGALVDGLLVLSRSTRGEIQRDKVNLSTMSERILKTLAVDEPNRDVTWEIEPDLYVEADPRMMEAVMSNLLTNAWKYTAKTDNAIIRVYKKMRDGQQQIYVSDNGAGFDMAHSEKLFQPFQRLHRQDEFVGIGIGLATVQRIIHRHGGVINAESESGKGATFYFTIA